MSKATLGVGSLLAVVGVVAYAWSGAASWTALIPAIVGVLLIGCGVLALREAYRRHAIHAAMAIALLAVLGSLMNVVRVGELLAGTAQRPAAVVTSLIMFVVLVVYLVFGIRSFIAARRRRSSAAV